MKKSKTLGFCLIVWAVCIVVSAMGNAEMKIPEDTSALEEFVETSALADEAVADEKMLNPML